MTKVDYDEHQHTVYASVRQMSSTPLQDLEEAFPASRAPDIRPMAWLDIGSGRWPT